MEQFLKRFGGVLVVLLIALTIVVGCISQQEKPSARGASVPVYMEQGGEKLVVATGGAIEIQSGGAIVLTPGATLDVGGASADNLVVSAPTAIGTATPAAYINNAGVSDGLVVADGGTILMQSFNGGGVKVAAPTAVGTAVPSFYVDSAGVSNLFEVRDAATPVFSVLNGGNTSHTGASSQTGNAIVTAPTAVGTATPGLIVDGLGVSNPLEIRVDATPVFAVQDDGLFQGVIAYGTSGAQLVCGTTVITDNANVSHGLTTPTFALCSLNAADTGDASRCTAAVSGANVTVRVYQTAATPTANSAGASVNWCVIGTP